MQKRGINIPFAETMNLSAHSSSLNSVGRWVKYLVTAVITIATLVLIGWQFDIEFFKHPLPGSKSMNPAAAVTFILASFSFLFLALGNGSLWKRITGYVFAVLVLLIGFLKLLSATSVLNIPIDTLLFQNKVQQDRIVPIAAVNFILTGIALLLLNFEIRQKTIASHYIVLVIFLLALLSLVGYLYDVKTSEGILVYIPMAIHAAVCFLLLSLAILFLHPEKGIMKEFTGPFSGSFIARFLIPTAIILPVLLGLLRLWIEWTKLLPIELGTAVLILTIIIVFLSLTWFIVVSLNKRDKLKQEIETALRESEQQMQTIFNAAPDAVIVIDDEGRIVKWNPQAESLLGWRANETLGKLLSETIIPDRFREMHKQGLKHFLKTGEGPLLGKIVETSALTKEGRELDIALNIAATPKINDKHLFIGFLRDVTEQKKSEQKFKGLLEAAPDAMIIADDKGEIVLVNHQTETVFGYSRQELIGKRVEILIPADFQGKHVGHRNKYFSEPKVRSMGVGLELFATRKDGTQFPVEISLSPLQTEEGMLVSASVRDITDRKKAEEKLKESEEKLRILFNSIDEGFCIIEMIFDEQKKPIDYRFLVVNPSFEKQTGLHNAVGKRMREFAPDHEEHWFEIYGRIALTGESIRFVNRAEQLHRWYDVYAFRFGEPKNFQVAILFNDITESKRSEELIKRQKQDIQDFIDSMSTLCAKVTTDGTLLMVNKIAMQASGLTMEELFKTNFIEGPWWTFDEDVHTRVKEAFHKASLGETVTYDENIFVFGQVLTINFSLIPIFKSNNEVDYIVAEGRDITALKITEAALTERTNQLVKLNEELEAFTYSVSHDLRAPLRGIIGFTNILEEDYSAKLDDEAKRITSVIKNNTLKMGQLIDDLLAFSRMGKKELVKTEINSMQLVREVINEMSLHNNDKEIRWNIGSLHPVNADINTIRQVWVNLISNAIKYSAKKDEPRIEIGSTRDRKEVVFYVKDNGVGFDEAYKDKLFKVFQRLHSAEEFEGTGVGLALVEKIVSRHGGKVWAEGKEGQGACFYFSLPADK